MPACAVEDGRKLTGDFDADLWIFCELFRLDGTFRRREVRTPAGVRCALLYLDGMVSGETVHEAVIRPLLTSGEPAGDPALWLCETVLYAADVKPCDRVRDLLRAMLYGDSVLLVGGAGTALVINTKGFRTRGISEPENEAVQKGPREGFDEIAMLNLSQLRRRLQTPDLAVEILRVGRRTDTMVFVCYLESLAGARLVREVKRRLGEISIDGILDANYIAELTRDHPFSLFETAGSSERPDVIASKLLEGRVALIVDGTPMVLTVPYLFCENFQSDEDYYLNFWVSSMGRFLRYVCFFLTVSVPALYLALLTRHTRLLPTYLLLSAAESRAGVPFSSLVECLVLILILEILGETGAPDAAGSGAHAEHCRGTGGRAGGSGGAAGQRTDADCGGTVRHCGADGSAFARRGDLRTRGNGAPGGGFGVAGVFFGTDGHCRPPDGSAQLRRAVSVHAGAPGSAGAEGHGLAAPLALHANTSCVFAQSGAAERGAQTCGMIAFSAL